MADVEFEGAVEEDRDDNDGLSALSIQMSSCQG
jgi:hypothetical protein